MAKLSPTRRILTAVAVAAGASAASLAILGKKFAAPSYQGPRSDHFDGSRFHNFHGAPHGFAALVKWMMNREEGEWPEWMETEPGPPPPRRVDLGARVTWVNHATILLQVDGLNILTDPIWSDRTSPVSWAGPKRRRAPGIRFEDLPKIDVVVVSHNHYDHLDLPTLRRLAERDAPRIFMPLGNSALLEQEGIPGGIDLDWWKEQPVGSGTSVVAAPAQHFSGRGLGDRDHNCWGGWVIRSRSGNFYFAGDTGYGPHFDMIRERYAPISLAMLPIGAFMPKWFMGPVHISPDEAVKAHRALGAKRSMAMHFGTFHLGDDGLEEPPRELARAKREAGIGDDEFWVLKEGEGREIRD